MDTNEMGAELHYFSKLCEYWSDKCTDGEITEEQMEDRISQYEEMSARQMKEVWERIK